MGDIRIWGRKFPVNVQLLLWGLDELNLAYQRIDARFIYGVADTDAFKEMNPNGRVSVLSFFWRQIHDKWLPSCDGFDRSPHPRMRD